MSDSTPRLKLPELAQMQELNAATINEALAQLDAVTGLCLKGQFVNTPPALPADGDAYLLGASPTGAWSGQAYKIAHCLDGGWRFFAPFDGLTAFVTVTGQHLVYQGGTWTALGALMAGADASIASAATCDLGAAGALCVLVTGTTTIISFGGVVNRLVLARFAGALILTHHAVSLILLGSGSRTTAANDVGLYRSDASGNWREVFYVRAAIDAGDAATKSGSETLTSKTLVAPVLVTPALGAATGASLALGGATIGSNALAVTGTVNISGQVSTGGSIAAAGNIQVGNIAVVNWGSRSQISSPADGNLTVTNGAVTGFNQFNFGGNTAAFPALKRSGNALHARRADDSDWSSFWCGSLIASYGVYLGNGGSQIQQSTDGVIRFLNGAASDFGRMQLGGTSSSFPSIKRNGAAINFRLADDSADAAITAAAGTFSGTVSASLLKPAAFTVATLPSASASGQSAQSFVTDAASPAWGATVAGGGSVKSPVFSDGANWKVG